MTTYKNFNVAELEEIAHGDEQFIFKWLETCATRAEELLQKMKSAIEESNIQAVQQIAHQLKPSFFYLGRKDLGNLLAELENGAVPLSKEELEHKSSILFQNAQVLFGEINGIVQKTKG